MSFDDFVEGPRVDWRNGRPFQGRPHVACPRFRFRGNDGQRIDPSTFISGRALTVPAQQTLFEIM
jgi:hypothetical protein